MVKDAVSSGFPDALVVSAMPSEIGLWRNRTWSWTPDQPLELKRSKKLRKLMADRKEFKREWFGTPNQYLTGDMSTLCLKKKTGNLVFPDLDD